MPDGNLTGNLQSARNSFSYEFEYNGCNTGRQKFGSKDTMCEGLKSQSRNNYCAVSMRERFFEQQGCPGIFELEK
ncbi:MAG TPA: hypothetical protein VM901_06710 [Bdellovibrionota bacterium]|jgi:hypothetical protein|nr:hypothetical protein [Bdellovibrionota bacterium]